MPAIISFAREGSTRLPGKNTMLFCGRPLIVYTLDCMKFLQSRSRVQFPAYVLTDYAECTDIVHRYCLDNNCQIEVIIRPEYISHYDDIRLNRWAHTKIKSGSYVLLQPTNPLRDFTDIYNWAVMAEKIGGYSVASVYKTGNTYKWSGNFFYYRYESLTHDHFMDAKSILVQDKYYMDINTQEEFERAEKEYEDKNIT